jgi:hypothetical protein
MTDDTAAPEALAALWSSSREAQANFASLRGEPA